MNMNDAYMIVGLEEGIPYKEVRTAFLNFIKHYNPEEDRDMHIRKFDAYAFLIGQLEPQERPTRESSRTHLTYKLGEVLQGAI